MANQDAIQMLMDLDINTEDSIAEAHISCNLQFTWKLFICDILLVNQI